MWWPSTHGVQQAQASSWKWPVPFNNFFSSAPQVVPRLQQMPLLSDNPLLSPPLTSYMPMATPEQLEEKYFDAPPLLFQPAPDLLLGLNSPTSSEGSIVNTQLALPTLCSDNSLSNPTTPHFLDTDISGLVKPEEIFPLPLSECWDNTIPALSPAFDMLASDMVEDEEMKDENEAKQGPSPPESAAASVYEDSDSGEHSADPSETLYCTRRSEKDQFLLEARAKKMTYKEIREIGGFTEAESTLRGRYRTLTKARHARVRRPHWTQADVSEVLFLQLVLGVSG